MNRWSLLLVVFASLGAFSCARQPDAGSGDAPAVSLLFDSDGTSKVDALASGDALGVFARVDGRDDFSLVNHKFTANNTGVLQGDPTVYYPDAKQATELYAYYPYVSAWNGTQGTWRTPIDQTAQADARRADLLWGSTVTTPSLEAVPMGFSHLLSRVSVEVRDESGSLQTLDRLTLHNVQTDGVLEAITGAFTLSAVRQNVEALGRNELIVPGQPLTQLSFSIGSADYSFVPTTPITLVRGVSYTLQLTLRAASEAARVELDRVVVGDWSTEQGLGGVEHAVSNTVTAHWLLPNPDFGSTTKVQLQVTDGTTGQTFTLTSDTYTKDPTSSGASGACTFTVRGVEGLRYPFRVESIDFLRADGSVVQSCPTLLAQGIYRSGAVSFGIYQDHILLVTTDPITLWTPQTVVGGVDNIKYKGNTFTLKLIEPNFDYTRVAKVRLKIWDGVAEWSIGAPTVSTGFANFVVETTPFTFPDASGYAPATRHYPIEWVELVDAAGEYLYRGYVNVEVSEEGSITLLLYQKGTVYSPSTIIRPIEQSVSGALGNINFVGNKFMLRFVSPDFIDASRPKVHTIRMGVLGDVFSWSGVSLDPGSSFFTAWTEVSLPDDRGYRPTNQYYKILWVEVLDASGGYLYKSYCDLDVTRPGTVTLDLHQRGVLSSPTTVGRPTDEVGESNPISSTKYVANAFDVRWFSFPFAYWNATAVALTCSDGKTYTWNTGISWADTYGYARSTFSWPDRSGLRPSAYPFKINKIEAFSGSTSLYVKAGLSVEVSAYGTVLVPLYQ